MGHVAYIDGGISKCLRCKKKSRMIIQESDYILVDGENSNHVYRVGDLVPIYLYLYKDDPDSVQIHRWKKTKPLGILLTDHCCEHCMFTFDALALFEPKIGRQWVEEAGRIVDYSIYEAKLISVKQFEITSRWSFKKINYIDEDIVMRSFDSGELPLGKYPLEHSHKFRSLSTDEKIDHLLAGKKGWDKYFKLMRPLQQILLNNSK